MIKTLTGFVLVSLLASRARSAAQAPFAAPVLAPTPLIAVLAHEDVTKPHVASGVSTMHLSAVSSGDEYTSLTHPLFPEHGVRIKKTDFCDPTVKFDDANRSVRTHSDT